jgi:hypothetical protein
MRLYPDIPSRRTTTIATDVAVVLAVGLFAWLGVRVHDQVQELAPISRGVQEAGGAVQNGFEQAGDAVDGAPLVGGTVGDALRRAGRDTGGEAVEAGRAGEEGIDDLARLLGWVIFLVPTGLLLARALPPRVGQVRRLTAAQRVLEESDDPVRRDLLARRAAFGLPYATLLRHTSDPLGDLAAGRTEALVAAVREDAGLRHGPRS